MALVVQKYGGTSVANLERIRNVADRVVKTFNQGNDVVVVLSAMSGVTDRLINMAHEITDLPEKRELDVLMATGEQQTVALLAMTLISMGYQAHSLLGHQAEVATDCAYGSARIVNIKASRVKELLNRRCIVVVAGFQGCDESGNITTLGRRRLGHLGRSHRLGVECRRLRNLYGCRRYLYHRSQYLRKSAKTRQDLLR